MGRVGEYVQFSGGGGGVMRVVRLGKKESIHSLRVLFGMQLLGQNLRLIVWFLLVLATNDCAIQLCSE